MAQQMWKPLPNGTHRIDRPTSAVGDWPTAATVEGASLDVSNQGCQLADNIRLCELVDAPDALTVRMTEERVAALETIYRTIKRHWDDSYRQDWTMRDALEIVGTMISELKEATE